MSRFEPKDYAPETPYLPGQRVVLNPECPNFRDFDREYARGNAGYVVYVDSVETLVRDWKRESPSHRAGFYARVQWDNGRTCTINFYDLLPVEAPTVDVIALALHDGSWFYGKQPEEIYKQVDNYVINDQYRIRKNLVYDQKWRDEMLNILAES